MNEKLKAIKIIHFAICAGVCVAYFILGDLSIDKLKIQNIASSEDIIFFLLPVAAILLGNFIFKSQLKQVNPKVEPVDNLGIYQSASITRWAILEGAAFVILILKPEFILLGIFIIAYLFYLRPTEENIIEDIQNVRE